jgi:protein involved in polysaccharide export with SLBB domain
VTVEPPTRNTVIVAGEVKTPGQLFLKPGSSLLSAIAEAGGTTQEGSASNVIVYRNGEPLVIDAETNLETQPSANFALKDGDTVIVRKNERVVYVFGQVERQGKVPVPSNKPFRVTDALALSGGLGQNGSFRRVILARPGPDGHLKIVQFNLDDFIKAGKLEANPPLQPGDILLFGQPKQTFLTSATQVIGSLLFVGSIAGATGLRTTLP